jgi:hypothetical protein
LSLRSPMAAAAAWTSGRHGCGVALRNQKIIKDAVRAGKGRDWYCYNCLHAALSCRATALAAVCPHRQLHLQPLCKATPLTRIRY